MPREVTLKGKGHTFTCYSPEEAKALGLIDNEHKSGTHALVSSKFENGEGHILESFLSGMDDAILIARTNYAIRVYRPKSKLIEISKEEMDEERSEE